MLPSESEFWVWHGDEGMYHLAWFSKISHPLPGAVSSGFVSYSGHCRELKCGLQD